MTPIFKFSEFSKNFAIIDENDESIRYSELVEFSEIIKKKIEKHSLVFFFCQNSIGCLVGYSSFIVNGIVPLLLDVSIDKKLLSSLVNTYEPEFIYYPLSEKPYSEMQKTSLKVFDYVLAKTNFVANHQLHPNLALLLATSGSTGSPKLVRLSYENLKANGLSIIEYLDIKSDQRPITTLPIQYSYGLSIVNSHLMVGATILLTKKSIIEKNFWTFFKKNKATSLSGVPFTFEMLKKYIFFKMELPSLKTITQAGGKLDKRLVEVYAKFAVEKGVRFFVMYGQTEASHIE